MIRLTTITMLLCLSIATTTHAKTENWCGTYNEKNGHAYIRIARDDLGVGSSSCNHYDYSNRSQKSGTANISLGFNPNSSTINNWRKFSNHLIEVRGRFRNGYLTGTRLIRDMGS